MRLAGGEKINDVLDIEFGLVVQHAIEEGSRTAQACSALILRGRIVDALAQSRDDILQVNARERPPFGKRRKLVDQRQRVSLPEFFRGHSGPPTSATTEITRQEILRSRRVAGMSSGREFVSSVSRPDPRGEVKRVFNATREFFDPTRR